MNKHLSNDEIFQIRSVEKRFRSGVFMIAFWSPLWLVLKPCLLELLGLKRPILAEWNSTEFIGAYYDPHG